MFRMSYARSWLRRSKIPIIVINHLISPIVAADCANGPHLRKRINKEPFNGARRVSDVNSRCRCKYQRVCRISKFNLISFSFIHISPVPFCRTNYRIPSAPTLSINSSTKSNSIRKKMYKNINKGFLFYVGK